MLCFASFICVAGFGVGLFKGWEFGLALFLLFPALSVGFGLSLMQ
jgi:hypothetical protein